ncbi:hypothetical protein TcWFU_010008 [Taenia crassiceps]|uniref:Uncharacterized protein n=1 Tax=Taenia crassiceps TaxID=6207 RepID=A0ABR4QN55_9CEST
MRKLAASLLFLLTLCGIVSFGEDHASDYKFVSELSLADVDVVIFIGCRIPSHGPKVLEGLIEDLNEVHSMYPRFDSKPNVYTPRYTPQRVKRVIFAPTRELSAYTDNTLDIYDSATKAATLAYLGAFKNNENVLIVVGSDIADNQTPWQARDMIELNIALGSLYPLYQPQNRTQRYEQFAIFNSSTEVVKFSESVESGRRIARYISSGQEVDWNYDKLLPLLQSTFQDRVIHVNTMNFSRGNNSAEPSLGGEVFHLTYSPGGAESTVFLISSSAIGRGLSTIVGFFETIRRLQPKETEFQAVIGCFNGGHNFLSDLHENSMNEVLGVQIPSKNTDVYVIGAETRGLRRKMSYYYGQQLDYEFGPLMDSNHMNNFIKKSVCDRESRRIFFLEDDGGGDSPSPLYSTPITGLVTHYLLKHLKQLHHLHQNLH